MSAWFKKGSTFNTKSMSALKDLYASGSIETAKLDVWLDNTLNVPSAAVMAPGSDPKGILQKEAALGGDNRLPATLVPNESEIVTTTEL